jgi:hypothetical protein
MSFGEANSISGITFIASDMAGILGLGYESVSKGGLKNFMTNSDIEDKSFSIYLKDELEGSYLFIPGMDSENFNIIATHNVI